MTDHGNRVDPGRRRITVDIRTDLADWLDEHAAAYKQGREIVVEIALRDFRRWTERNSANPRP